MLSEAKNGQFDPARATGRYSVDVFLHITTKNKSNEVSADYNSRGWALKSAASEYVYMYIYIYIYIC